ncbi:MAG: precorrin-8X methylmutase, partial [Cyanobacteria bacterium P01_H01_bin.15]
MALDHPIVAESFVIIDREIGDHGFSPAEYAIARRVIHATADFEFAQLLRFSPDAIDAGQRALRAKFPVVVDVRAIEMGVQRLLSLTFQNELLVAIAQRAKPGAGQTRTEAGLLQCAQEAPQGIYVIGNAPTALQALCGLIEAGQVNPALVIGVPVGFVAVSEAKAQLAALSVPQINVQGRKGGSPVASAILNALLV